MTGNVVLAKVSMDSLQAGSRLHKPSALRLYYTVTLMTKEHLACFSGPALLQPNSRFRGNWYSSLGCAGVEDRSKDEPFAALSHVPYEHRNLISPNKSHHRSGILFCRLKLGNRWDQSWSNVLNQLSDSSIDWLLLQQKILIKSIPFCIRDCLHKYVFPQCLLVIWNEHVR